MRFMVSERTILPLTDRDGNPEWVEAGSLRQGEALAQLLWPGKSVLLRVDPPESGWMT